MNTVLQCKIPKSTYISVLCMDVMGISTLRGPGVPVWNFEFECEELFASICDRVATRPDGAVSPQDSWDGFQPALGFAQVRFGSVCQTTQRKNNPNHPALCFV